MRGTRGCVQGGILSPLFWNLVVNNLLKTLNKNGIYAPGYVDDIVIVDRGQFITTLTELAAKSLRRLEHWSVEEYLRA